MWICFSAPHPIQSNITKWGLQQSKVSKIHSRVSGASLLDFSVPSGHTHNLSPSGKTFPCKTEISLQSDKKGWLSSTDMWMQKGIFPLKAWESGTHKCITAKENKLIFTKYSFPVRLKSRQIHTSTICKWTFRLSSREQLREKNIWDFT